MSTVQTDVLILAGGRATRLNGVDKGLVTLNGQPLIEHVINRSCQKHRNLIISANRNLDIYRHYSQTVVGDIQGGFQGPLAGIYSSYESVQSDYLLVIPCDMPFLPTDLSVRLKEEITQSKRPVCAVNHGNRIEPLLFMAQKSHLLTIKDYLNTGQRSVTGWLTQGQFGIVDYHARQHSFLNINTEEDLRLAHHETARESGLGSL